MVIAFCHQCGDRHQDDRRVLQSGNVCPLRHLFAPMLALLGALESVHENRAPPYSQLGAAPMNSG
jgi:hypothetical protein